MMKRDEKILAMTISKGNFKITFRDSLLMLPHALSTLGAQFEIMTEKGMEPFYVGFDPNNAFYRMDNITHYSSKLAN